MPQLGDWVMSCAICFPGKRHLLISSWFHVHEGKCSILRLLTLMAVFLSSFNRTLVSSPPGFSSLSMWEWIVHTWIWMRFSKVFCTHVNSSVHLVRLQRESNSALNRPNCRVWTNNAMRVWLLRFILSCEAQTRPTQNCSPAKMPCVLEIRTSERQSKINTGRDTKCCL